LKFRNKGFILNKRAVVFATVAVGLILAGCTTPCPELSGTDYRLRRYGQTTPPPVATPVPSYLPARGSVRGKNILIDPGHGGKDPGTLGIKLGGSYGMQEKEVVLDVSKKIATKLSAMGANVRLTRSSDVFIELDERAAMVSRYGADIFVSIHADYISDTSIAGPTCYIARQSTAQSRKIAQSILNEFEKNGIKTRGLRQADYRVLVRHPKPSTLVEVGYLSNPREARLLNTDNYRNKVAEIVANGIANSF
jgi:N-acetylmuramoyl-L-alanine amidase